MEFHDYYKTLEVPRAATQAEIKKGFRNLARQYHPDKRPGDKAAERRFKELNEANEVLSDPAKRAKYDRFGHDWEAYARAEAAGGGSAGTGPDPFRPGGPFAAYRQSGSPGGVRYEFRTTGDPGAFSDFFRMMFGDDPVAAAGTGTRTRRATTTGSLDDILAGMGFGGAAGPATGQGGGRRGAIAGDGDRPRLASVEATAELTLEEVFHGTTRIVELGDRRLEVKIPRGVDTGSRIRLSGKGPDGRDLVVVTRVRPHPVFNRKGADLDREIPVTLEEALLGGEVPVGTLKGRVLLKLPAGTQNGRTYRLKGQGLPRLKGDGSGDLYVRVLLVLPTDLSDDAKAAARRFVDLVDQPDPRA